jgi:hypothetical protein
MTTKRRRKNRLPPFVPLIKITMATPTWRAMSAGARLLYIELRGRLRNDYANNGKVFLSCRAAAKAIGAHPGSVVRWYAENEHFGFLRKTSEGFLGVDGRGMAAHYRFTEFPHGTHPPTRDFEKWDGKPFVYSPRRGRRKKQNPVRMVRTPRAHGAHIRNGSGGASVCTHKPYIGTAPRYTHKPYISRKASPQAKPAPLQGSSTARAPVQAGDAGSSPAPVAKPVPDAAAVVMAYCPEADGGGPARPAWDAAATRAAAEAYVSPSALEDPTPAPPWAPYAQRDIDHQRHSREGLMVYVADVIETQLRNLDEAKEAKQEADQPVSAPDPTPERRLSSRRVQEHARWYSDEAYWHYSPNALAAGALDAALRANLRKEVFPEHVEIEFERVMKAVPH